MTDGYSEFLREQEEEAEKRQYAELFKIAKNALKDKMICDDNCPNECSNAETVRLLAAEVIRLRKIEKDYNKTISRRKR